MQQVKPLWDRSSLTLAELAELCSISESSASRYLNGKISPPADVAERILQVLGGEPPEDVKPAESPAVKQMVEHIREIYQAQIKTMQENFSVQLTALRTSYETQIAALQRDKIVLFITVLILLGVLVYFIIDALHGNWGIIRYAMAAEGGV